MVKVKFKKLNSKATVPSYGSASAAGADLYACLDGGKEVFEVHSFYAEPDCCDTADKVA